MLWGYGVLLTMVVIVREQLYGQYPTRDVKMFALSYGGYCIMPVLAMVRVLRAPVFKQATPTSGVRAKKENEKKKK